ncbi:integrator complex subunit 7 [Eurytemora carolleeae]|uniref:integrator complex subunit 7 n=1 Tax=Eurytemora carolleeae TaxID=1294199 RepID=UPI000C764B01|nr:integrator complex subunit 7 [Eurytemora carolleeae]|eukprot:XP_023336904.1 integrator complex subunit 7-like [Eurytemora affinis]
MALTLDMGYPGSFPAFHDSEQGSSAALTELDKGLRSQRPGEQSEAIVKFPRLFEKYPFPVLINTALLKLAEVFRQGSNFLKLCVLRVCQQSERHLDKVTSVDELVRRIITVMNSNDPVARALTLRTLGALAGILFDRKQVHHKVRSSLDSQDSVEVEAAIFAAERFSARSRTFSVDMCPKLLEMIQGYATPLPVKLKIIPVLEHMHHDANTATLVRAACLELLPSYPGHQFMLVILQTLTSLSQHTFIHIPDQVSLLLECLSRDPRRGVQDGVLSDLNLLAGEDTAHLWSRENVEALIEFVNKLNKDDLKVSAINILRKLIEAGGVYLLELGPGSSISNLCQTFCYSPDLAVASASTHLLTQLAVSCCKEGISNPDLDIVTEAIQHRSGYCYRSYTGKQGISSTDLDIVTEAIYSLTGDIQHRSGYFYKSYTGKQGISSTDLDIVTEAIQGIESLCLLVSSGAGEVQHYITFLKTALKCVILLCSTKPEYTGEFVDILGGMLDSKYKDSIGMLSVCQTLAALAGMKQSVLSPLVPDICSIIQSIILEREAEMDYSRDENPAERNKILVLLLTILLQTVRGHTWSQDIEQTFRSGAQLLDNWSKYRVGRAASRYGEHQQSRFLFSELKEKVWTENFNYWLQSLEFFSRGEEILARKENTPLQEKLVSAATMFQRGLTCLRAGSSVQQPMRFQQDFIKCRIHYLQVLTQLTAAATSLQTSPPPAIAAALAAQSRDDLQRCGRVTGQLRKVVKDLQTCAQAWTTLAESSFDADPASLSQLLVLQKMVSNLAMWIEIVCLKSSLQGSIYTDTMFKVVRRGLIVLFYWVGGAPLYLQAWSIFIYFFQNIGSEFKSLSERPDTRPISHHHTSCIFSAIRAINSYPLPYPRFFYQSLQETRLKISVTPQSRAAGEPVQVNTSQLLAIKVEGVIERSGIENKQSRKVSQVVVHLQSILQSGKSEKSVEKSESGSSAEQSADIQNDFFAVQFLTPFPQPGLYNLALEAKLIDSDGNRWRTGVKQSLIVKSFEDRTNASRSVPRS